jgi:acetoacetyl-CoA synthetase
MVLSDALFNWFYDEGFPPHVQLANISGGTDLAGCFGISNPLTPVYVGGCQGAGIGMKVEVFDSLIEAENENHVPVGKPVPDREPGELVCTAAFPNQPISFWGDENGEKYFKAYYARFEGVWAHGDFIQKDPETGHILFLGRADGVLNPSGVRFGSAEIYSVIEANFPEVQDSICVGQRRKHDPDESVMLFLLMKSGHRFTADLVKRVKKAIEKETTKRHVPKYVFETPDIPVSTILTISLQPS